jgi:hypothetical protein
MRALFPVVGLGSGRQRMGPWPDTVALGSMVLDPIVSALTGGTCPESRSLDRKRRDSGFAMRSRGRGDSILPPATAPVTPSGAV